MRRNWLLGGVSPGEYIVFFPDIFQSSWYICWPDLSMRRPSSKYPASIVLGSPNNKEQKFEKRLHKIFFIHLIRPEWQLGCMSGDPISIPACVSLGRSRDAEEATVEGPGKCRVWSPRRVSAPVRRGAPPGHLRLGQVWVTARYKVEPIEGAVAVRLSTQE